MSIVQITLPDRLKALAESRVAETGHGSMEEYIVGLIEADQAMPVDAELEAELLKGLTGESREFTSADWDEKRRRLRENHDILVRG